MAFALHGSFTESLPGGGHGEQKTLEAFGFGRDCPHCNGLEATQAVS